MKQFTVWNPINDSICVLQWELPLKTVSFQIINLFSRFYIDNWWNNEIAVGLSNIFYSYKMIMLHHVL